MLKANSRTLPIEDIKVPNRFAMTTPGREKVDKAKQFYGVTGQFDHSILVDQNGYIFDGYARYTAAKELGLDKVPVVQIVPFKAKKKVEDKPAEDTLFDWDAFRAGKIVVHCDTDEKAKAFLQECEECGFSWANVKASFRSNWKGYGKDTCYSNMFGSLGYGNKSFYEGKSLNIIDYPFSEQPKQPTAEDKQEPIKLYCVKDSIIPSSFGEAEFTEGTVCTFNPAAGALELPDGSWLGDGAKPRSYDDWKADNPSRADCLVPLVKRPAKVGEWVYITHTDYAPVAGARLGVGDVCRVASVAPSGAKHLEVSHGYELSYFDCEYLVLDGYHAEAEAEPEPEPEYFSGKVVCVSSGDECFAVGKMYEFINGEIKDDDGDERPVCADERFKSVEEWNSEYGMPIARFIEYKGEAHD